MAELSENEAKKQQYVVALHSIATMVVQTCASLPGIPLDSIAYVTKQLLIFGRDAISPLANNDAIAPGVMRLHRAFVAAEKAWSIVIDGAIEIAGPAALRSINGSKR